MRLGILKDNNGHAINVQFKFGTDAMSYFVGTDMDDCSIKQVALAIQVTENEPVSIWFDYDKDSLNAAKALVATIERGIENDTAS
jgi:hypothetical protein